MKNNTKQLGVIFIAFAFLCFFTSCYMDSTKSKLKETLQSEGGIIGPINVKKDKSVYEITVYQPISWDGEWSHISGELLDEKKEYLIGFGDEFWKESGYDSEGHWSESKTKYDSKLTIPKKGIYYFKFVGEKSKRVNSNIYVTIEQKRASALPSFAFGILSLIVGIFLSWKSMFTV